MPCFLALHFTELISSVQSLSRVWLFATPWTAARQASLSITNSRSLLKLCPLSHPTISSSSSPSPPAFNLSQHQGLFKRVSSLHQVAKVLEFQLQHLSFIVTIFFTNWRFVTTLYRTSLLAPFFSNSICSLCVSVMFW